MMATVASSRQDVEGGFHFNGDFRNAAELKTALTTLGAPYHDLVEQGAEDVAKLFEEVFEHRSFTGRSGTFFAYEGLGSIYWHMVSKLGLAVAENVDKASSDKLSSQILKSLNDHLVQYSEWNRGGEGSRRVRCFPDGSVFAYS
jgi:hypothetical protein